MIDDTITPGYSFRRFLNAGVVRSGVGGLLLNVIFDPLVGYFYKRMILGNPAADVTLAWNIASTSINAVTSTIVSVAVYMALRPALKKSDLFFTIGKNKKLLETH